jgi:hypothetical protein
MKCEHYWRDGILLIERGQQDPHHNTCVECRRAHEERDELVQALPRVGATSTGDPQWQARVWSRIARNEAARARRSYWFGAGLVAVCAVAVVYFAQMSGRDDRNRVIVVEDRRDAAGDRLQGGEAPLLSTIDSAPGQDRPRIEIVYGKLATRSTTSARIGDRVRVSAEAGQEVRLYRAERLVLRCRARVAAPHCMPDAQGLVAEAELATAGDYQLVFISAATADPVGTLDRDLAAVVSAGGDYRITELSVR